MLCGIDVAPGLRRKHFRATSTGGDAGQRLEVLCSPAGRLGGRARGPARLVDMVEHVMTRSALTFVEGNSPCAFPDVEMSRAASSSGSLLPFN